MSSIYICVGYVGSEIDHGQTNNGNSYANWSMAIRSNPKQEDPDWFNFVAYKSLADIVKKYVNKGDLLHITRAYPRNRKWTDKDGNDRTSQEFIVNDVELMPKKKGEKKDISTQNLENDYEGNGKVPLDSIPKFEI
jgi:single stranded DNA-binding protein